MTSRVQHDAALRLAAAALAADGQRLRAATVAWNIAGNCTAPVSRTVEGRPAAYKRVKRLYGPPLVVVKSTGLHARDPAGNPISYGEGTEKVSRVPSTARHIGVARDTSHPVWVELEVRCRKCDNCLRLRRWLWTLRARIELAKASRTWFGTITLDANEQFKALSRARLRARERGEEFDELDFGTQFRRRVDQLSPDISNYWKRVRKQSGAPIRYLWVAEYHKSGAPHFHCLVHEMDRDRPVTWRDLHDQWKLGFTKWNLVGDPRQGTYLTKYLSKTSAARVRASLRYGTTA